MRISRVLSVLILTGILFSGCTAKKITVGIPSQYSVVKSKPESGLTPAELAWLDKNCFEGVPELSGPFPGVNRVISREGYALSHNSNYRIPLWVAEGIAKDQFFGNAKRRDRFFPDPNLPLNERAELSDYKSSGFDRGHQAPAGDFGASQKLKDETFSLANMAPQVGPLFNQGVWRELEAYAKQKIIDSGKGYIITGPIFYDPNEEDPSKADGVVEIDWIGNGRVAVPTHFFKIIILLNGSLPQCESFVLENRAYPGFGRDSNFQSFHKSVDWIEQRTGINFMPNLDPARENLLERN